MAQIDASIPLGVRQVELPNQLAQLAQVQQLQGLQQRNKLADLQFAQFEREAAKEAAVADAWRGNLGTDGTVNRQGLVSSLAVAGQGAAIPGIQKTFTEQDKATREAEKARLEQASTTINLIGQVAGSATDPVSYAAGRARLQAAGVDVSQIPEQFDPAYVAQARQQALTAAQQLEEAWKQKGFDLDTQKFGYQQQNDAANRGVTIRGQDLSASTSLANAAATRDVAQSNRDSARIQTQFGNEQGLRKEFDALPEVKNYKQALPAYQAVKDAAERNTPQADINLVYGIAKLYDPNSVVREGEYATIANSANIPEWVKGQANYLAGGGKLSATTKKQILAEADGRLQSYQGEVVKARDSYANIAKDAGIPAGRVLQGVGDFQQGATSPSAQSKPKAAAAQVPAQAADYLRANPSLRAQFDAKYGTGAAASILGK